MPPLTTEELQLRKQGIGSSDIGAILGVNPFKSAIDVWLEKTGRVADVERSEEEEFRLRLGHRVEDILADEYSRRHGVFLERLTTQVHPEYAWALATPDRRVAGTRRYCEFKNVGWQMMRKWTPDDDGVPPEFLAQATWQLFVVDGVQCDISALIGGRDNPQYSVLYDADLVASMAEIAATFWYNHVVKDTPPPVDASEGMRRYLETQHPRHFKPLGALTAEAETWIRAYEKARLDVKAAKERQDLAANTLRALIGDAEGIGIKGCKATWKTQRGAPNLSAVVAELGVAPELLAKHTTELRVLRVTCKE